MFPLCVSYYPNLPAESPRTKLPEVVSVLCVLTHNQLLLVSWLWHSHDRRGRASDILQGTYAPLRLFETGDKWSVSKC